MCRQFLWYTFSMFRITLQLVALALALAAVRLVIAAETFASYLLRDGLLIAVAAAVFFAWHAGGWRPTPALRSIAGLAGSGQIFWLTGLVCLVAGGIGTGFDVRGLPHLVATLIWGMGMVLLVVGAWWPGAPPDYDLPVFRWEKDADGRFVRVATADHTAPDDLAVRITSPQRVALAIAAVLLLALLLRGWNLAGMPPGCMASECINGLRLVDGQPLTFSVPAAFNLFERVAQLLYAVTGAGVLSLRLTAAALGTLTVVCFAGVVLRLTRPAFVAPALLLMALNPWHIWASRTSDGWVETALWVTLVLWLGLSALARADLRGWAPAGLSLGLLFGAVPLLRPAVLLWGAAIIVFGVWAGYRRGRPQPLLAPLAGGLASALGMAAPTIVAGLRNGVLFPARSAEGAWLDNAVALTGALLRPGLAPDSPFVLSGLLSLLAAALAIVGLGAVGRNVRQPAALLLTTGLLAIGVASVRVDLALSPPAGLLLALLPLLLAAATIAIDRMLAALVRVWGSVVRPSTLVASASLVLLLILGAGTVHFVTELDALQGGTQGSVEGDIARYIADQLAANAEAQQTFVVPYSALRHPSLRLLAGNAVADGRILPLDVATTMPFSTAPPGDVIYLVPTGQGQLVDLLRQIYPTAPTANELSENGQRLLFTIFQIAQESILESQGIRLLAYPGNESQGADTAAVDRVVRTTTFDWRTAPPLPPPFFAEMYASLLVPQAGPYTFSADVGPGANLVLKLDDLLVLDTLLGVTQQSVTLAQGLYHFEVSYRNGDVPADLRIRWQLADSTLAPLPATAFHLPVLANAGLLGEYTEGTVTGGMPLTQRKDLIVGLDAGLSQPYTVHWQGRLGIARAGEYLIGTISDGPNQLAVNGAVIVDSQRKAGSDVADAYAEGLIYLDRGWHALDIRYAPHSTAPEFRILWQPPGSSPAELTSVYLTPATADVSLADQPPPPAPPLTDPMLGNDDFALTRAASVWQPSVRIPVSGLEALPLETLWTVGGSCGAGEMQFNAPHGLAFDDAGSRLYVADTGNRRVQVLDLDGGFRTALSDPAFAEPVDVALAPDGSLLLLDAVAGPIYRIGVDGAITLEPLQTTFYRPRGLDVAADGSMVVADTGGGRVVVFFPGGAVQSQFGGPDTPLARGQPVDALLLDGYVWAISAEDGRLWNLYADGSLTAIQPTNTIDGPQLAALPDGSMVVTDPLRRTFTIFTASGRPVRQFAYGEQLVLPTGVTARKIGEFVYFAVSDTRSCAVSLWRVPENQIQ